MPGRRGIGVRDVSGMSAQYACRVRRLTRISHQGHGLRDAVRPTGQESRAARRASTRAERTMRVSTVVPATLFGIRLSVVRPQCHYFGVMSLGTKPPKLASLQGRVVPHEKPSHSLTISLATILAATAESGNATHRLIDEIRSSKQPCEGTWSRMLRSEGRMAIRQGCAIAAGRVRSAGHGQRDPVCMAERRRAGQHHRMYLLAGR